MKPVKVHEAKTNFSKLLAAVERGEEVVVQRGDTPVAKLVPYGPGVPRKAGILEGKIKIAPDFDEIPPGFEGYVA